LMHQLAARRPHDDRTTPLPVRTMSRWDGQSTRRQQSQAARGQSHAAANLPRLRGRASEPRPPLRRNCPSADDGGSTHRVPEDRRPSSSPRARRTERFRVTAERSPSSGAQERRAQRAFKGGPAPRPDPASCRRGDSARLHQYRSHFMSKRRSVRATMLR